MSVKKVLDKAIRAIDVNGEPLVNLKTGLLLAGLLTRASVW